MAIVMAKYRRRGSWQSECKRLLELLHNNIFQMTTEHH